MFVSIGDSQSSCVPTSHVAKVHLNGISYGQLSVLKCLLWSCASSPLRHFCGGCYSCNDPHRIRMPISTKPKGWLDIFGYLSLSHGNTKKPTVVSKVTQKHNTEELHNYHSGYDIHTDTHTRTFVANGFKTNGSCGIRSSYHTSKSVLKS